MIEIEFDFKVSDRYKYFVTKEGQVFKLDTRNGKMSECYYHVAHGYKRIRVTDIETKTRRYLRVHRSVAKYFVKNPKPNEYDMVNHIDGDKMNNHYENLEWCNHKENCNKTLKVRQVGKYDKAGNIICIYKSLSDASYYENKTPSQILGYINSKPSKLRDFVWKYI